ncbi:N-hydroxyarylamine O-acetyltransferase [Cyclobacterium lianum]|uniref:N-hydroxyarylamine O-acetyltransferase n=1 Tax=Cyclobacterium lianum TaxID=388280 RepID=A0A1M7NVF5_9BACT|nr:arylamine N-acetyltransferase [Cyclobacterium lianum]SHN07707.1 N-hydroxyarylamine O-acetyltransferase [Cyclobacterium lianum]
MFAREDALSLFTEFLDDKSLQAYFNRVGYSGEKEPSLDALKLLHYLHPQAIPFENLNPFLGMPVRLDLPGLLNKMVLEGRGGYCFEQNMLFGHVLNTMGFLVKGLSARVFWEVPSGEIKPRDHMLLLVQVDGRKYIADVGFGGSSFTAPLSLDITDAQETPHERFRLNRVNGFYYLEIMIREEWRLLYRFSLEPQLRPDYEVVNWYLGNHPESMFVNDVMAARCMPWGRYALFNNLFTTHRKNEVSLKQTLTDLREYKALLEEVFLIQLPHHELMMDKFKKLLAEA